MQLSTIYVLSTDNCHCGLMDAALSSFKNIVHMNYEKNRTCTHALSNKNRRWAAHHVMPMSFEEKDTTLSSFLLPAVEPSRDGCSCSSSEVESRISTLIMNYDWLQTKHA
jgi:hypothetical protein